MENRTPGSKAKLQETKGYMHRFLLFVELLLDIGIYYLPLSYLDMEAFFTFELKCRMDEDSDSLLGLLLFRDLLPQSCWKNRHIFYF